MELDEKYCNVIVDRFIDYVSTDENVFIIRDNKKYTWKEINEKR